MTEAELLAMPEFSIKRMYNKMMGDYAKVSWRRLICNTPGAPKWLFILQLVPHGRIYTRDRLNKWGMQMDPICPLCEKEQENIDHLFFQCDISCYIWAQVLRWQGINILPLKWAEELQWCMSRCNGKNSSATIFKISLAAAVYHIWLQRNQVAFQGRRKSNDSLVKLIIQECYVRVSMKAKLASRLTGLDWYPR
ncbi:uncharacterized protein LOC132630693 [Lycium barbarum]|uniref:uncharacterized protein LOC132630693 n=1 Tax=Lycium barbarum TaxID=112863 RepID=UPI00293E695D|nr:uncharacterized protein LOC132630693 [Lycium barbarum]